MVRHSGKDLNISGYMRVDGGIYDSVKINGSADLNSALQCNDLKVNGTANISGSVNSDYIKVNGRIYVRDSVEAGEYMTNGKSEIEGSMKADYIKVDGSLEVKRNIEAGKIKVNGEILAGEGLNAEEMDINGRININSLLNADRLKFELYWRSYAGEIGGEHIVIKKGDLMGFDKFLKFVFSAFGYKESSLNAGIIEGDDIYLEATQAKIVRGKNVVIGEGCSIELVEYKDTFRQQNGGYVKESKKI